MAGVPSLTLMENAGRAVADAIAARFAPCAVRCCAGRAIMAATALSWPGCSRKKASPCGLRHARPQGRCRRHGGQMEAAASLKLSPEVLDGAALVVDALFGAGLSRPLEGAARDLVAGAEGGKSAGGRDRCSQRHRRRQRQARWAMPRSRADLTVTFFRKKPAHLLLPGRDACGEVLCWPISAFRRRRWILIRPAVRERSRAVGRATIPGRRPSGHKYGRGHCVVVSGPAHATGAARLAARGALRIGAGLVSVASPPEAIAVNAAHLTAIMVKPFDGPHGLGRSSAGQAPQCRGDRARAWASAAKPANLVEAVLAGGAAAGARCRCAHLLSTTTPTRCSPASSGAAVLTPHEGEFERLFPGLLEASPPARWKPPAPPQSAPARWCCSRAPIR